MMNKILSIKLIIPIICSFCIYGCNINTDNIFTNGMIAKGKVIPYEIFYNPKKWKVTETIIGGDGEFIFTHENSTIEAEILPERYPSSIEVTKKIFLNNERDFDPNIEIISEEIKNINGNEILVMKLQGQIEDTPYMHYDYLYSDDKISIHFNCAGELELMKYYEQDIFELLNGLYIYKSQNNATITIPEKPKKEPYKLFLNSKKLNYNIMYDANKWFVHQTNPEAYYEYKLEHIDKDVYVLVIPDEYYQTMSEFKEMIMENFNAAGSDVEVVLEETRNINGNEILALQVLATVQGLELKYYGYYFVNENFGTIQFIIYCHPTIFDQYEEDMTELLNSLKINNL